MNQLEINVTQIAYNYALDKTTVKNNFIYSNISSEDMSTFMQASQAKK
jgi:hypothetical protein